MHCFFKLRMFIKYLGRKISNIFYKKLNGNYNYWTDYIYSAEKKGADIWGGKGDSPVPVGEKFSYQIMNPTNEKSEQIIITKMTDYIFWVIPFSYYEYIIRIPYHKYDNCYITSEQALLEVDACRNWNRGSGLHPMTNISGVCIHTKGGETVYEIGNNDYSFLTYGDYVGQKRTTK